MVSGKLLQKVHFSKFSILILYKKLLVARILYFFDPIQTILVWLQLSFKPDKM